MFKTLIDCVYASRVLQRPSCECSQDVSLFCQHIHNNSSIDIQMSILSLSHLVLAVQITNPKLTLTNAKDMQTYKCVKTCNGILLAKLLVYILARNCVH